MIQAQIKSYYYFLYGSEDDYGQKVLSGAPDGSIKMAISTTSNSISDSIIYSGAQYIGLTQDTINDSYVIKYGEQKLKVLYVNTVGFSIGRLLDRSVEYPEISEVYPTLFNDKEIINAKEEARAKEQTDISVLRFKQFALKHNQKIKQKEVQQQNNG